MFPNKSHLVGSLYLYRRGAPLEFTLGLFGDEQSFCWRNFLLVPLAHGCGYSLRVMPDESGYSLDVEVPPGQISIVVGRRSAEIQPEHTDGCVRLWITLREDEGGHRVLTEPQCLLILPECQILDAEAIQSLPKKQRSFPGFGEAE